MAEIPQQVEELRHSSAEFTSEAIPSVLVAIATASATQLLDPKFQDQKELFESLSEQVGCRWQITVGLDHLHKLVTDAYEGYRPPNGGLVVPLQSQKNLPVHRVMLGGIKQGKDLTPILNNNRQILTTTPTSQLISELSIIDWGEEIHPILCGHLMTRTNIEFQLMGNNRADNLFASVESNREIAFGGSSKEYIGALTASRRGPNGEFRRRR